MLNHYAPITGGFNPAEYNLNVLRSVKKFFDQNEAVPVNLVESVQNIISNRLEEFIVEWSPDTHRLGLGKRGKYDALVPLVRVEDESAPGGEKWIRDWVENSKVPQPLYDLTKFVVVGLRVQTESLINLEGVAWQDSADTTAPRLYFAVPVAGLKAPPNGKKWEDYVRFKWENTFDRFTCRVAINDLALAYVDSSRHKLLTRTVRYGIGRFYYVLPKGLYYPVPENTWPYDQMSVENGVLRFSVRLVAFPTEGDK